MRAFYVSAERHLLDRPKAVCYICSVFRYGRGDVYEVRQVQRLAMAEVKRSKWFADLQSAGSIWPKEDSL
jgi:hypothetical protein